MDTDQIFIIISYRQCTIKSNQKSNQTTIVRSAAKSAPSNPRTIKFLQVWETSLSFQPEINFP